MTAGRLGSYRRARGNTQEPPRPQWKRSRPRGAAATVGVGDASFSRRFRDSALERVLVSPWAGPLTWVAVTTSMTAPFLGRFTALVLGALALQPAWAGHALAYSIGACAGAGLAALTAVVRRKRCAAAERGADARLKRAARLVLHRGELADDPAANRIAASLGRIHLREGWTPLAARMVRVFAGGTVVALAVALYFIYAGSGAAGIAEFAGVAVQLLGLTTAAAAVSLPARLHTNSRRIVALQAAEAWSGAPGRPTRSADSGCPVM
ncbi:hypothetical protein [Streptomonospora wellingtoniae]|uniref:Uncharacterized protein n=1 Tax=Streptomonospora wellingtoniae TaxID=3075544 RepID=A0ABU2KS14_9ACTN|nr:hypothetical protein [Streptomonospora sp. DSM 45055]MDT0301957.1 hypothetical protein [Streptomonospora sp. DSM 45055]